MHGVVREERDPYLDIQITKSTLEIKRVTYVTASFPSHP